MNTKVSRAGGTRSAPCAYCGGTEPGDRQCHNAPCCFVLPLESESGRAGMVRWLLRRLVGAFERQWNYDASYLQEMIDASPRAAWRFKQATKLANYCRDVPLDAWVAAGLTAV